jgi:hypothetical protein
MLSASTRLAPRGRRTHKRGIMMKRQPWLGAPGFDLLWIVGPAFFVSLFVLLLWPAGHGIPVTIPVWVWLASIVGVDVAHVYSTLYRTYLDPEERARYRSLLYLVPLFCWIVGVMLHAMGGLVFWTVLAYLAVFHFVRQQYGFVAIYSREEPRNLWPRRIDAAGVYLATLYPLVYWHAHLPRHFDWFVSGDFPFHLPGWCASLFFVLWCLALAGVFLKEIHRYVRTRELNVPRNLFIAGTALSWWVGIIHFNADLPFTLTNVVAHGVPYMALVWLYGRKKSLRSAPAAVSKFSSLIYHPLALPLFFALLFGLAYFEEALWDALVWREHKELFHWLWSLPPVHDGPLLSLLVPLLALPQATHYVLDAFIWRVRRPKSEVAAVLGGLAHAHG